MAAFQLKLMLPRFVCKFVYCKTCCSKSFGMWSYSSYYQQIVKRSSWIHSFISIQPQRPGWEEPEPSHVTGMALAHFILGKFLGVVCHCFPPPLDVPTFAAMCLYVRLRCCATNWKVAGSIPAGVIGIFHWHNPSDRTMALGSTQPLTEMSTRSTSWS